MSSKCTITFDNNQFGVYYAGQIVSGTAELITARPKTIRSISITVSGFAEVRWTENVTKQNAEGKSEQGVETFSASEIYYSSERCVYGQSGGQQIDLPAGKYAFPFQVTVPPNAPTSFNGTHGQIQHEVSLVIDRVMRYNNIFKQAYTVISPFDLNLNPENAKSLQKIEEKTFCWSLCCGTKGPMVMHVNSPFSAYAPGQKIRFKIVLDNQSDVHCYDVKVRLIKRVTYTCRSPQTKIQVNEIKVADNHCGEVVKLNKAEFNEFVQIPSTTPTSLESCGIIKVHYFLRFIAKLSRIHGDIVIEFPINIGTVPLYASANDQSGPITGQPGSGPAYKPLPPPTYEEDVRSEQFENNKFKPRYPVFLTDANQTNGGGGGARTDANVGSNKNVSPPRTTNNVYPTPAIHVNPSPPPQAPYSPQNPAAASSPAPPYPVAAPRATTPTPRHSPAAATTTTNRQNGENIEVLGFSVPPDYRPTPSAPNGSNSNVGWK